MHDKFQLQLRLIKENKFSYILILKLCLMLKNISTVGTVDWSPKISFYIERQS